MKKKPKGCAKVSIIIGAAIIIPVLAQPFGDRLRAGAFSVVPRKVAYITPSCQAATMCTLSPTLSRSHPLHLSFSTVPLIRPCFAHHQLQLRDTSFRHPCFCGDFHCQHPLVVMYRVGTFYMTIPPKTHGACVAIHRLPGRRNGGPCRSSIRSLAVPQNICKVSKRSFSWVQPSRL